MPRIYKGTETILKLLIDVPNIEKIDKLKIVLFTDDRNKAQEFYSDSITLHGNVAYVTVYEWTFIEMNDGIINYIAQGESNNKPFIFERQSNYILKSSDGFEESEIMNGYYTKNEVDTKLEEEQDVLISGETIKTINGESILGAGNIEVKADVDLTGYATEQWVRRQGYVTDSDVNDYVGNEIGQVEERFNDYYTKVEVDELVANGGGGATELIVYDAENFTVRDLFKIHTEYTEGKNVIFFRDGVEYCTITNFFHKNLESNEHEFRIEFDGQADGYYAFYKVVPNEVSGEILDEKLYYQRGDAQTPVYTYEIFNENNEIRINNRDVLMIYRNVTIGYPVRLHNSMEDGYYNVVSAEARRKYPDLSTTYKITALGNLGNSFPSAFYIQTYIPNSVSGEFLEQLADVSTQQMLLTWDDAFNQFYRKSEIDETIGDINNILTSI